MNAARAERVLMLLEAERHHDRPSLPSWMTDWAHRDRGWRTSQTGAGAMVAALVRRWESRSRLQVALEGRARASLRHVLAPGTLEVFIEQQIATEQSEYIAEFFWLLQAVGCAAPDRMAAWIDRHNALVIRYLAIGSPLGPQRKRVCWRLRSAPFSQARKATCVERQDGRRIVLSLSDLERFMAFHMDATLCRDRLDALTRIGLLTDETYPNLRLFRGTDELQTMVADALTSLIRRQ
jgi:hypothetical protein